MLLKYFLGEAGRELLSVQAHERPHSVFCQGWSVNPSVLATSPSRQHALGFCLFFHYLLFPTCHSERTQRRLFPGQASTLAADAASVAGAGAATLRSTHREGVREEGGLSKPAIERIPQVSQHGFNSPRKLVMDQGGSTQTGGKTELRESHS